MREVLVRSLLSLPSLSHIPCRHTSRVGSDTIATSLYADSLPKKQRMGGDVWLNQLMQIPGVSYQGAQAITRAYPSLRKLLAAYMNTSSLEERHTLLAGLERSKGSRLGPSLSRRIHAVFHSAKPSDLVLQL